jgi:hypothetical protein
MEGNRAVSVSTTGSQTSTEAKATNKFVTGSWTTFIGVATITNDPPPAQVPSSSDHPASQRRRPAK